MSRRDRFFKTGYHRANRAGMMALILTVSMYLVPTVFLGILLGCGVDIEARAWGLSQAGYLCLYLSMYVLMMGIPLVIVSRCLAPHEQISPLNLSFDRRLCIVVCGVAVCLLANILAALLSGALFDAGVSEPSLPQIGDGSVITLLFDLLVFAFIPAIMEETLLRGIILQTLRPLGNGVAVTVSAVLFGLMHGNLRQVPYALLMGVVLGVIYVCTDNLRLAVITHATANALSIISMYLLQFTDAATASFWELVMLVVVLMLGGAAALWLWQHPLGRQRATHSYSFAARRKALCKAPLLWIAVGVMAVLMLVFA